MKVTCPKCGSDQLSANKKGFSGGKAVAGAILTGGIGLLAGTIGSSKVVCTCLACGNTFRAGQGKIIYEEGELLPTTSAPAKKRTITNEQTNKFGRTIAIVLFSLIGFLIVVIIILSKSTPGDPITNTVGSPAPINLNKDSLIRVIKKSKDYHIKDVLIHETTIDLAASDAEGGYVYYFSKNYDLKNYGIDSCRLYKYKKGKSLAKGDYIEAAPVDEGSTDVSR